MYWKHLEPQLNHILIDLCTFVDSILNRLMQILECYTFQIYVCHVPPICVLQMGDSVVRACPGLRPGNSLSDFFQVHLIPVLQAPIPQPG